MARDLHQSQPSSDNNEDLPEPPQIRRLRRLVSALMVVLMVGILFIAGALVWKLTQDNAPSSPAPLAAEITVPEGFEVLSVSRTGNRLYLVLQNTATGDRQIEERNAADQTVIGTYRLVPESGS